MQPAAISRRSEANYMASDMLLVNTTATPSTNAQTMFQWPRLSSRLHREARYARRYDGIANGRGSA